MSKRILSRSVMLSVFAFTTPVMAQVAAPADDTANDGSVVTVYAPIRDSQRAALVEQRKADNLVSVISADTVGRFPDQNSAAALSRLPAVAVQRDQGQERYIQVRGAPNRWTSVSFDGIPVIGVDEGGSGRAFRFDAVPAVILKSLAVNKSLTADLPAEAVVGQIDLRTYSAFDRKGFDFQGDVGVGQMELGGGEQRQGSARMSYSNATFGIVAAVSHYRRDQVTDNREFAYDSSRVLSSFDARNYRLVRENNGGLLGLEWRLKEGHKVFAKFVLSQFKDDEERNHYTFQLANAISGIRTATGGDLVGVPVRSMTEFGEYRTTNRLTTIGGEHFISEKWNLSWRINASEMSNDTNLPLLMQNQQFNKLARPSMTYRLDDPNFPIVSLYSTVAGATAGTYARGSAVSKFDQGAFDFNIALPIISNIVSDSVVARVDVKRYAGPWTFAMGLMREGRDIEGNVMGQPTVVMSALLPLIGQSDLKASDYVTTQAWDTGFALGTSLNYIDNRRLRRDLDVKLEALKAAKLYNPAANIASTSRYKIDEDLTSAYASAKYEFGSGQVVLGGRLEDMHLRIQGVTRSGSVETPLIVEQSYTDFFPSANARFDLGAKTVLRGSVQRGIARPSFGAIRTGASINDTASPGTISGGNPNLKPEYTWGIDASYEYYPSSDSVISVGGFYRLVDNVLYDSKTKITDNTYDTATLDRTGYDFTSTLNGDNGKLYGVEFNYQQSLSFLPGPFDGLGVTANIALLDGEFDTVARKGAPFPGTSNTVINTSVYYEKHGASVRLSYQWRDDWADTLGGLGLGSGGDEYRKAYGNLDLTLRYAINDKVTVYADASNLTDETYIAFEGDENHPSEVEQIGRRFMLGLRFNY